MKTPSRTILSLSLLVAAASPVATAFAQRPDLPAFEEREDGAVVAAGRTFASWSDYLESDLFRTHGMRCATPPAGEAGPGALNDDCGYSSTNPRDVYDPGVRRYRIPVVVHVIERTNGRGAIPDERVRSQIDILNEDFLALPGTNGQDGTDIQIEFFLATTDPDGNPTTGITRTVNNTWFDDDGDYYRELAWDPHRYMNIYTNSPRGALGYVPFLPQDGNVGGKSDRVVILHSVFGRNAPEAPYDQGRTATHEVGHYLGLWHTFDGGCHNEGQCFTRGDTICDTNTQREPNYDCPRNPVSCSTPDPYTNYMDYTDDLCMTEFTAQQARRIRCTLESYRPDLAEVVEPGNRCVYSLKHASKARGGCDACPARGDRFASDTRCEQIAECDKKLKLRKIDCPDGGAGACRKVRGVRESCG